MLFSLSFDVKAALDNRDFCLPEPRCDAAARALCCCCFNWREGFRRALLLLLCCCCYAMRAAQASRGTVAVIEAAYI